MRVTRRAAACTTRASRADIFYPDHNPEPADVLSNMATTKDAAAALDSYNPQHKGYKALKAKLAELRGTVGDARRRRSTKARR